MPVPDKVKMAWQLEVGHKAPEGETKLRWEPGPDAHLDFCPALQLPA